MEKTKGARTAWRKPVRASAYYAAASAITKGISMLSTPIFTRLFTPEEYAAFPLFLSWLGIIGALCSHDPTGAVELAGLEKFKNDESGFTTASIGYSFVITLAICVLYFTFTSFSGNFTGLSLFLQILLFVQIFFDFVTHHLLARWRSSYRGATVLIFNSLTSLGTFLAGTVLSGIGGEGRIIGLVITSGACALFIIGRSFGEGGRFYDKGVWRYMASTTIPLIPQLLASAAIAASDKLMIRSYFGEGALGKYSVAHSLGIATTFASAALGYAIRPWILKRLGRGEGENISEVTGLAVSLLSLLSLLLIAASPELMRVLAPSDYSDALFATLPIALSVIPAFLNGIVTLGLISKGRARLGIFPSVAALIINVFANSLLFRYFHYTVAAVSALISSCISLLLNLFFYSRIHSAKLFPLGRAFAFFAVALVGGALLYLFRGLLLMRIILILLVFVLSLPYLHEALSLLREDKPDTSKPDGK